MEIQLSKPQTDFFNSSATFPLFCGGYGCGKSLTMGVCILRDLDLAPGVTIGAYAPTYDLLKLITIPYLEELFEESGTPYKLNKSEYIFYLSNKRKVICRSMDTPARIVGYQTVRAHVDELDTMVETQAKDAWEKIIARNRQQIFVSGESIKNIVRAYTTPEGFGFVYNRWVKHQDPGYEIVRAPTYSNPTYSEDSDYIQNLKNSYSQELVQAYIEGDFVNMTSGAVYPEFDRKLNNTDDCVKLGDALHIGMDFNVNKMAAVVHVVRPDGPRAVDEIAEGRDTPEVCEILKSRYPNNHITIYPDAAGRGTSSKSASQSDISILKSYGFKVDAPNKNPRVKDRVIAVNSLICNSSGERKYLINVDMCPVAAESLEQQVYGSNGEPDKKADKDHHCDAIGYFLNRKWPVVKRNVNVQQIRIFGR